MAELGQRQDLVFLDGAVDGSSGYEHDWLSEYGDLSWMVNNSSLTDYSRRAYIHGHPEGLSGLISAQIGQSEENAGLDLAAGTSARALRDLLESGVLGLALATNYEDLMPADTANDSRLSQITGDLTEPQTWHRIRKWKNLYASQGFKLVMHRPVGGLQELSPHTYSGAAHFLLDMVQPGGMMFTQVPRRLVKEQSPLAELCHSIRSRPDVGEVYVTEGRRPKKRIDENDMYAAILKS